MEWGAKAGGAKPGRAAPPGLGTSQNPHGRPALQKVLLHDDAVAWAGIKGSF